MCIAILNQKSTLEFETLKNSFDNNNQGAGLLFAENNILKAYKTYDFNEFTEFYYSLRNRINTPIVLHFRIATSGFSEINLHPFFVNKGLAFVHNGVFSGLGNKEFSDTYQFCEMLKKLPQDFLKNKAIFELLNFRIERSKLIFLDSSNNYTILNENLGIWDNSGNWYSNDSYLKSNDFWYYGNEKVNKKTQNFDFLDDFDNRNAYFLTSLSKREIKKMKEFKKIAILESIFKIQITDVSEFLNFSGYSDLDECLYYESNFKY